MGPQVLQRKLIIVIAHSDDFRWFGPDELLSEWDLLVATFNRHKYEVTDATNKEFVGIHIYHDEDFNYYMDQSRMIDSIIRDAGLQGDIVEKLPYPMDGNPLSELDCATEESKAEDSKYQMSLPQGSRTARERNGPYYGDNNVCPQCSLKIWKQSWQETHSLSEASCPICQVCQRR